MMRPAQVSRVNVMGPVREGSSAVFHLIWLRSLLCEETLTAGKRGCALLTDSGGLSIGNEMRILEIRSVWGWGLVPARIALWTGVSFLSS